MGGHSGSAPTFYMYHIFGPFLLVVWAKTLFALFTLTQGELTNSVRAILRSYFAFIAGGIVLISVLYSPGWKQQISITAEETNEWEDIRKIVAKSNFVLNSSLVTSFLIENNLPIFDSGQSEYFTSGSTAPQALKDISIYSQDIEKISHRFDRKINSDLKKAKFDTIILSPGYSMISLDGRPHEKYQYCKSFSLVMPQTSQKWKADLYRRVGNCP